MHLLDYTFGTLVSPTSSGRNSSLGCTRQYFYQLRKMIVYYGFTIGFSVSLDPDNDNPEDMKKLDAAEARG